MATKFLDAPLSEYTIHKIALAESGYNYYMYIHATGQILIMREKEDETEYLYADGGRSKAGSWASKVGLDYKYYDELA